LIDHWTAAPLIDHLTAAPLIDHLTAAPLIDHWTAIPLIDHLTAPLIDHLTAAHLIHHWTAAHLIRHWTAASRTPSARLPKRWRQAARLRRRRPHGRFGGGALPLERQGTRRVGRCVVGPPPCVLHAAVRRRLGAQPVHLVPLPLALVETPVGPGEASAAVHFAARKGA
jgi:hypothetical protein